MANEILFKLLDTLRDLIKDSQETNRANADAYAAIAKDIGSLREMVILKADSADVVQQLEKVYNRINSLAANTATLENCKIFRDAFMKFDTESDRDSDSIKTQLSDLKVSIAALSTRVYITWGIGGTAIMVAIGIIIKTVWK